MCIIDANMPKQKKESICPAIHSQKNLPKSETLNIVGYFQQLSTHGSWCCIWQDWISFPGDKQEGCCLAATETAKLEKINLSDSETTLLI